MAFEFSIVLGLGFRYSIMENQTENAVGKEMDNGGLHRY